MFDHPETKFLAILVLVTFALTIILSLRAGNVAESILGILVGALPITLLYIYNIDCVLGKESCTTFGVIQTILVALSFMFFIAVQAYLIFKGQTFADLTPSVAKVVL